MEGPSKIIICRGAIATERRLLAEVEAALPRTPAELEPPVRIVVPSRSLRLHLLRRLVEERGAVAGVVVQTLGGAAREIMERAGDERAARPAGFELVVRRLARNEPALAAELEALDDGYGVVLGAVRDLVDAGFTPELEDGVLELVDELAGAAPRADRGRAAALARVAARAMEAAALTGCHPRGAGYRFAAEAIRTHGGRVLPARALLVHGFADLTGVAADLLDAVLRACGGVVLLDRVPDPVDPDADDVGNAFLDRLVLRLGGSTRDVDAAPPRTATVGLAEAPDPEAEARWIAEAVRRELDAGVRPEAIGIVARQTGLLGPPLRRHLGRLGVAFSGIATRVPGGSVRRKARRLADLLRRGGDAELDLWLEVADGLVDEVALLLGLRVLSLTRLRDLAALRHDDPRLVRGVPLPLGPGLVGPDRTPPGEARTPRLSSARVAPAIEVARGLVEMLEGWPDRAPPAVHLERTGRLLLSLGWSADDGHGAAVVATTRELAAELPDRLELESAEWTSELIRRLDGLGEIPVGGQGGGVQLLSATEARARTFDRLFVCGLDRGVFPRPVVDDAMLPDALRGRMTVVLPEMPVKARSADEERYLFAQLLSAADVVSLSWHLRSRGTRAAPSPFVERLRAADPTLTTVPAGSPWSPQRGCVGPRPSYEHAVLAAAGGARPSANLLTLAVEEGRAGIGALSGAVPAARLALARLEVVGRLEPAPGASPLGPWSGFVGSATSPGERVWVTHLERVATCPWQAFVGRRLGVRPLPDPHLGLPDPDHRLVGNVVHEVLERIVAGPRGERSTLDEALPRPPRTVPWPPDRDLDELVIEAARRVVFDEGLGGFGLVPLLAARARPVLEVAREVEWGGGGALEGVLAAEIVGELAGEVGRRVIGFRADRLDAGPRATDYKTGGPLSGAKKPETRARHLLAAVATGRALQAAAYALATPGGIGRYLYLRPEIGDAPVEARVLEATGDDPELGAAFDAAVRTVDAALVAGAAFPRVAEPKGKKAGHCEHCEVAEACRVDDSSFTRRLVELMEGIGGDGAPGLEEARELWWLGVEREASP
ncbi:MAG: PD-(D/E)XK nuclease family protein [Thermoanaerobaculales bacterium]|jgi:hypothetical protein|nr:PD-(D/E)XK nuclease family protein [Thermoanaerobaculales bacterium]